MADAGKVLKNALALDVDDRAAVAERLLASLDDLDEKETEHLWAVEAHRRLDGYRNGRARAIGAHRVAGKVEGLFRRTR